MSLVRSLVQRATASGTGRRPRAGGTGRGVGRPAGGAPRRQDEMIGRGVRSLLGRARRR